MSNDPLGDAARALIAQDERRKADRRRRTRNGPKIPCPACRQPESIVLPDKSMGFTMEGTYRRMRQCKGCGTRFTSVERFEELIEDVSATSCRRGGTSAA